MHLVSEIIRSVIPPGAQRNKKTHLHSPYCRHRQAIPNQGCSGHTHLPLPHKSIALCVSAHTSHITKLQRTAAEHRPEEPAGNRGFGDPRDILDALEIKPLNLHSPCVSAVTQRAHDLESAMQFDHVPAEVVHPPTRLCAVEHERQWSPWCSSIMLSRAVDREGHRRYTRGPDCLKHLCYSCVP